jgi:DNA-binding NarL/FixJ family response regulator
MQSDDGHVREKENMNQLRDFAVQPDRREAACRVFVLAHQDFYLEGLLAVLARSADSEVVACVKPGDDCWNAFVAHPANVVLIHRQAVVDLPERVPQFLQYAPELKIIVFGHEMSDAFLLRLVRLGVSGYINERMSGDHLLKAIRRVLDGELWVERHILQRLILRDVEIEGIISESIESIRSVLTKREAEIYRHILDGLATKEIASEMCVSEQGVKLHLGNIFKKFEVKNKHQLIVQTFQKICPVDNVQGLFRAVMDRPLSAGDKHPLPLDSIDILAGD